MTLDRARKANPDNEDNKNTISRLEDLISMAGKIVSGYTKHLAVVTVGAVSGPDIVKVRADFGRARKTLMEAQATALRIIEGSTATNVGSPAKDGLPKLLKKWRERTQDYATTIRELVKTVREAAALQEESVLRGDAEKAAQLIESLVPLFRGEVFSSGFKVLMNDLSSIPPNARDAEERKQLAARENSLRVMRQLRSDLTHPLLRKLTEAEANPVNAVRMRVVLGGISTTLKEIELQALASA